MPRVQLRCTVCSTLHEPGLIYQCPSCGGILRVEYPYSGSELRERLVAAAASSDHSIWRYRDLLPVDPGTAVVSMGEGATPLVRCQNLTDSVGVSHLYFKNEACCPTCSFKDRPISVALTKALELGVTTVVTASTGNTGASVAAYAARAGLRCIVLVPDSTSAEKLNQALAHNAQVVRVKGDFGACYMLSKEVARRNGWLNLTTTFLVPYTLEGDKTVAYELLQQLGTAPTWIAVPIGAGPLLVGIYKGFQELYEAGLCTTLPRMIGAQGAGCAPIARAFAAGSREVEPWGRTETVASAIADPLTYYAGEGSYTLSCINDSRGYAVAVPEEAITPMAHQLAAREGLFVEVSSATSAAAVRHLAQRSLVGPKDTVVCVLTGHGLKQSSALAGALAPLPVIEPKADDLERILVA